MAIALKIGVCDLLTELLAHTLGIGRYLSNARTISATLFETFFHQFYDLLIFIKSYLSHIVRPPRFG